MYFALTFSIMFGFWVLLSGKFDLFHLALGIISSAMVSYFSNDILFVDRSGRSFFSDAWRFIRYLPWLMKEIALSTLHVTRLSLHPRMKELINPQMIRFQSRLKRNISQVTFANSITLTPGTITVRVVDGEFHVHALTDKTAAGLPGEMEESIAKVFGED